MAINGNNSKGVVKNFLLRYALLATGTFFVFLALIGIVLPLVPTTPFLLVAAACFYKSSNRFYTWLITNKFFGTYLRDYKDKKGIPWRVKLGALLFLWLSLLISAFYLAPLLWIKILLMGIGIGVSIHILLIRTKRS
ncbi:MAG: YbaN family protein [Bacteroidales bacterium]|nr:YbaN family protein [Bacteroidales bacterium]